MVVKDIAWISTAPSHASNQRPLRHSFSDGPQVQFAIECKKRNMAGEPLGPDCFPDEIYGAPGAKESDYNLPDVFYAGSFWVVSNAAARILRLFELGGGGLYPVKVLKSDRATPVDGDYYCINFGNQKATFLPDESRNVEIFVRDVWQTRARLADFDLALDRMAQEGSDIWIEQKVDSAIFLSFELGAALRKEKADRGFFLKKCRIV